MQDLAGGAPRPVTPEGVGGLLASPDGTRIVARDVDGQRKWFPIDGSAPEPFRSIDPADLILRFTADGRGLLVRRPGADGVSQISRLDLATGVRAPVRQIAPLRGANAFGPFLMTADAGAYVFGYGVTVSDLYLVKGLR